MLEDAERARAALATRLELPRGYDATIAVGLAAVVAAGAIDVGTGDAVWGKVLVAVVLFAFAVAGSRQVHRFRELNGVWISGLRRGATIPATLAALAIYVAAVFGAAAAADAGLWGVVALIAIGCGAGYWLASRWWMRLYCREHGA